VAHRPTDTAAGAVPRGSGVFFISGFLISRSYEKTGSLADYWRNRALRIFPALHVCVLLNLLLVLGTGYFALVGAHFWQIAVLYLAKTTIFQLYNPDFMRDFEPRIP
jgi:peptidoglycan/LPS O-acetylase OafA/YrhL